MKSYDLYLESGPMKRKTYIHVPALPGCIAHGDTTDEAIANAPGAIRTFLSFVARHGEEVDAAEPFKTRVAQHIMDGQFLSNAFLEPDRKPISRKEADRSMTWLSWIHDDLREATRRLTPKQLDAKPPVGRPIRRILQHVCVEGGYLRGVSGASRIMRLVDQGHLDAHDALDQLLELERARLAAMTPEEMADVVQRGQSEWSVRSAVRRMLEHGWEHYLEITERLGLPA